jgi:hypothetical protein
MRRRPNQVFQSVFARLPAGHHHQVLAAGHRGEFMRDLEGAQQPLVKQRVRRQPGDVLAIHRHAARRGGQYAGDHVEQGRLAAPLGPISPVIDCVAIRIDAPSTAWKPPKCLWTSSTTIIASPFGRMARRAFKNGPDRRGPGRDHLCRDVVSGTRPW